MVEAKHQLQLGRALSRWARYDLIALDEVGYIPLAEIGAEFLFQVIAERAEKAAVIVTTNAAECRRWHADWRPSAHRPWAPARPIPI
jgi:DNA replication protein DnaC